MLWDTDQVPTLVRKGYIMNSMLCNVWIALIIAVVSKRNNFFIYVKFCVFEKKRSSVRFFDPRRFSWLESLLIVYNMFVHFSRYVILTEFEAAYRMSMDSTKWKLKIGWHIHTIYWYFFCSGSHYSRFFGVFLVEGSLITSLELKPLIDIPKNL